MLCFAIYSVERRIGQVYREILAPWGLSYTQYVVLLALGDEAGEYEIGAGASVGRLGELLGLDSGTLSPLLKRLETRGVVRRSRSAGDERVVEVALTASGRDLLAELADVPRCFADRMPLTADEASDLLGRMRALDHGLATAAR